MSNRPAEHSDGDRSTRNAAFGAESYGSPHDGPGAAQV